MTATGSGRRRVRVVWVQDGGVLQAYVDGEHVASGDWDTAPDAVIGALREIARAEPERVVVADFEHERAALGTVLIDADGTVRDADDTAAAEAAEGAGAQATGTAAEADDDAIVAAYPTFGEDPAAGLVTALRRGATPAPSPTAIPGLEPEPARPTGVRPAPAYRPAASPTRSPARLVAPRHEARRREARRREARRREARYRRVRLPRPRGLTRRRLIGGGAALAALLALALVATLLPRTRPAITLTRDESLGVPPPAEWQARSRWRTPPLLTQAGRILMIDGTAMAFVTKDRTIALVDVEEGRVRWSARYPDGVPGTDLAATSIDGRRAVAAHVGDRLAWWDLDTGEARDLTLPAGGTVNLQGSAPLVISDQGRTAGAIAAGHLTSTAVPAGATAIAARSDGVITATGPAGWWHLGPGKPAANPVPWETPTPTGSPTVVAYLSDTLVTVLPAPASGTAYVAIYRDRPQDVRFVWGGPAWFDGTVADWFPSPSRRWGILGRTLVDLTAGRTMDLGKWATQTVSSDRAAGTMGRQRVIVGPQIPAGVLPQDEAFPEDLATTGAAVRAAAGPDEVVYLLPPKASP